MYADIDALFRNNQLMSELLRSRGVSSPGKVLFNRDFISKEVSVSLLGSSGTPVFYDLCSDGNLGNTTIGNLQSVVRGQLFVGEVKSLKAVVTGFVAPTTVEFGFLFIRRNSSGAVVQQFVHRVVLSVAADGEFFLQIPQGVVIASVLRVAPAGGGTFNIDVSAFIQGFSVFPY